VKGDGHRGGSPAGWHALDLGDWDAAARAFEEAFEATPEDPWNADGLGRARWWSGDTAAAVQVWARAYAGYREAGLEERAARAALFLSSEYRSVLGNDAAASGWLARAERLVREGPPSSAAGWLALTKAERAVRPPDGLSGAAEALAVARELHDADLELAALGAIGLARIRLGDVDEGMRHFDEAMAAATSGEPKDLRTLGDLYCAMVTAAELTLDMHRFGQWSGVVMAFLERHRHPSLFTFCGTCCAEVVSANGDWQEGERWLVDTLRTLEATGQRPRCVHPATKLASLRVWQGRLEEAEHLLEGYEDLPEAVAPMVALHLARNQPSLAAARLHRRLNELGRDSLVAAPLLSLLVEVQVARGDLEGAAGGASALSEIAARSGLVRMAAEADLAEGSIQAAREDPAAPATLERSLSAFIALGFPQQVARARLALARSLAPTDPEAAVAEGRQAVAGFERLGATRLADQAARFLRTLGVRGRTGPKNPPTVLTRRETEVLRLLGEGLTNAEIAARLYISTKTAGTHVSNILAKLGLRNRAEAAAYAQRWLFPESAPI